MNFKQNEKGGWIIPEKAVIPKETNIPDYSEFGNGCRIGNGCELGDWCKWLGVVVINWLTMANVDGSGRQLKIIKHSKGVKIEAGCFCGDSAEFLQRAEYEKKNAYAAIVGAAVNAMTASAHR